MAAAKLILKPIKLASIDYFDATLTNLARSFISTQDLVFS